MSYTGEEVQVAQELTWDAVEPALPPPDICGKIKAIDIAVGGVKEYLRDPLDNLLPEDQWPDKPQKAMVHCSDEEWEKLAVGLVKHNICEVIELDSVFGWSDHHLLHGLFGVLKNE